MSHLDSIDEDYKFGFGDFPDVWAVVWDGFCLVNGAGHDTDGEQLLRRIPGQLWWKDGLVLRWDYDAGLLHTTTGTIDFSTYWELNVDDFTFIRHTLVDAPSFRRFEEKGISKSDFERAYDARYSAQYAEHIRNTPLPE